MAKKKCFLSFHYKPDCWRVQQVKNMGKIEEQPLLSSNSWETIKQQGDDSIRSWIDKNLKDKDCLIVLVGTNTASRRWVKYEIKKAWEKGMGVLAIHVHNLKDASEKQSTKGSNPFDALTVAGEKVTGKVYDPPYSTSTYVYDHIASNIQDWVKTAIDARK
ncbi:TIR domain-containing protein [Sphingomonas sp. C8-2]|nr:TIR domain-containing protein [Sphingomonas sp. C8-2]